MSSAVQSGLNRERATRTRPLSARKTALSENCEGGLRAELREFLDAVVVPALVKKYLAELEEVKPSEKTACACELPSGILAPVTLSVKRQGRNL
jgi:hypothetical protein